MSRKSIFKVNHEDAPVCSLNKGSLKGLRHRTVLDHSHGSSGLSIWQEEHLPGFSTPLHRHDCAETITVLKGVILAVSEDKKFKVFPLETFFIPEWLAHGFQVIGETSVKLLAVFNSSKPGIYKLNGMQTIPPWEGGSTNHLN